jgi:dephospho-CoA kinase
MPLDAGRHRVAVGLTGGIACGKSEVARILTELGVAVLDTDQVAHRLMEPGRPVFQAVVKRFGESILGGDGRIDRGVLGGRVFRDPVERAALNALVHPAVGRAWKRWLAEQGERGASAVVAIPLLFEVGATGGWTSVVCVSAPEAMVIARLRRRGMSEEDAQLRVKAQMPVEEKARRADVVIVNDGTLDNLKERVTETWQQIIEKEHENHG